VGFYGKQYHYNTITLDPVCLGCDDEYSVYVWALFFIVEGGGVSGRVFNGVCVQRVFCVLVECETGFSRAVVLAAIFSVSHGVCGPVRCIGSTAFCVH
jgi:hypothetical protein